MKRMKELKRKLSVLLVLALFISGLPASYADVWAAETNAEYDLISDETGLDSTDGLLEADDRSGLIVDAAEGTDSSAEEIITGDQAEDTDIISDSDDEDISLSSDELSEFSDIIDIADDGATLTDELSDELSDAADSVIADDRGGEAGVSMNIVDGMAQPMVSYSKIEAGYTNKGSDILRFAVYVETDYDTDRDGMNDLVQAVVQVPRAAAEQKYDAPTIFEASPYFAGTGDDTGLDYKVPDPVYNPSVSENDLYVSGTKHTAQYATVSSCELASWDYAEKYSSKNWYYNYENAKGDKKNNYFNSGVFNHDYFLIRGFAVVVSAGLGTNGSDGLETCGSKAEVDAFKNVVEWINHMDGRRAFADREGTIPVEADWSNGKVAMRGASYNGTMAYEVAATGVEGLETVVPEAAISSWYEYSNTQGVTRYDDNKYTSALAGGESSRFFGKDPKDPANGGSTVSWDAIRKLCSNLFGYFDHSQTELAGHYGDYWASREFSNPTKLDMDKIHASALIIQGFNDYNVRTKQADLMRNIFKESNNEVRMILHQGGHETLESIMVYKGMYFNELLNKWYCHYLLGVDNDIENILPKVCVQSNKDGAFYDYDEWYENDWYNDDNKIITVSSGNTKEIILAKPDKNTQGSEGAANPSQKPGPAGGGSMMSGDDPYYTIDDYFEGLDINRDGDGAEGKVYFETWMRRIPEEITIQGKPVVKVRASVSERPTSGRMILGAMLYDISSESFPAYEADPKDPDDMLRNTIISGGIDMGEGLDPIDYQEFKTTSVKKKLITKGVVDLSHPDSEGAGYEPWLAVSGNDIETDTYHDYTIHMLPTFYTVRPGHYLWLYLIPDMDNISSDTDITFNNGESTALIPVTSIPDGFYDAPRTEIVDDDEYGSVISEKVGGKEVARKLIEEIGGENRITTLSSNIWIRGLDDYYLYVGSPVKPDISVYDGTELLTAGRDYKISYKDNSKPTALSGKKARLIITFKGEYVKNPKITEYFEIEKFNLSENKLYSLNGVYAAPVTAAYTGKNLKPVPEVRFYDEYGKVINKKNFKFSYLKEGEEEATLSVRDPGNYTVYIEPKNAKSCYTGWAYTSLTVIDNTKKLLSKANVKFTPTSSVYTGTPIIPGYILRYKLDGKHYTTLSENVDYEVTLSRNNTEPGKAELVFTAIEGNDKGLTGSVKGTFKITKGRKLSDLDPDDIKCEYIVPYTKSGAVPSWVNVYDGDRFLVKGKDYTLSYKNNKKLSSDKNTARVYIKGKGRYKGTVIREYYVVQSNLSMLNINVSDKLMKKGSVYRNPGITITDAKGKKLTKNKDYTIKKYESLSGNQVTGDPDNTTPGMIRITLEGKGNYFGEAAADYMYYDKAHDLSKATVSQAIVPRVYTGSEIMITDDELENLLYAGRTKKAPGTRLIYKADFYVESYKNNIKTGTAKVTLRGTGKYGGRKTLKFKIKRHGAKSFIGIQSDHDMK